MAHVEYCACCAWPMMWIVMAHNTLTNDGIGCIDVPLDAVLKTSLLATTSTQQGSRILKGIDAVGDAASMSVMIETIGSRNLRWLQRKRDDFLTRSPSSKHIKISKKALPSSRSSGSSSVMPHDILQNNGRLQHAISSSSSSSGSSASSDETRDVGTNANGQHNSKKAKKKDRKNNNGTTEEGVSTLAEKAKAKKVSSSSSSNDSRKFATAMNISNNANDFHDYHARRCLIHC
jgi:hypothetical protein